MCLPPACSEAALILTPLIRRSSVGRFLPAEARVGCTDLVSKQVFPSTAAQALVWLLAAGCWGCVFVKQRSYL